MNSYFWNTFDVLHTKYIKQEYEGPDLHRQGLTVKMEEYALVYTRIYTDRIDKYTFVAFCSILYITLRTGD